MLVGRVQVDHASVCRRHGLGAPVRWWALHPSWDNETVLHQNAILIGPGIRLRNVHIRIGPET